MKPMNACTFGLVGAALACLLSFSAFGADEASPVAKPDVKAGDRWVYRRTDHLTNKVAFTRNDRVASTGPDEILVVSKRSDQTSEFDIFQTSEWGAIAIGGLALIPRAEFFKFPLKVGATHQTAYETTNRGSPARFKFDFTVKVLAWEDVAVPAGNFRALKVEANGTFIRLDSGQRFGGMARFRFWYVPEIKRWAKSSYEQGASGFAYPDVTYTDELIQFALQ